MPQQRTIPAVCAQCGLNFLAFDNSRAKFCSNRCVGHSNVRPVEDRFFQRVNKTATCWLWTGASKPERGSGEGGYGCFSWSKNDPQLAHRAAWALRTGEPVPEGFFVIHTCDVRLCVRNDDQGIYLVGDVALLRFGHLALGTHADNMTDARLKGRLRGPISTSR